MPDRAHRVTACAKVWLEARGHFAVGEGGVRFLAAIHEAGSIRVGAEHVGWSYRHALGYLRNAERQLGRRLVARTRGGNDRGGAVLTPAGLDLVRRYERLRARLDRAMDRLYATAFEGWP